MNEAGVHDAEVTLGGYLLPSPTAHFNWLISDRKSRTRALSRIERLPQRRLRCRARRRLTRRLYQGLLPLRIMTSPELDLGLDAFLRPGH